MVTQTILGVTWSFDCKIAVVKVVIIFSTTPYLDVHLGLHHVQATQPRGLVPAVGTPLPGVRLVTRTALAVINRWCGCHSRVSDGPYILAINNWSFRVQNDVGKSAKLTAAAANDTSVAETRAGNTASPSKNSGRYAAYIIVTTAPTHHGGST